MSRGYSKRAAGFSAREESNWDKWREYYDHGEGSKVFIGHLKDEKGEYIKWSNYRNWSGYNKPSAEWTPAESKWFNGYFKYSQNYTATDLKNAREHWDKERFGITPRSEMTKEQIEKKRNEVAGLVEGMKSAMGTYREALAKRIFDDGQASTKKKDKVTMETARARANEQISGFAEKIIEKAEQAAGPNREIVGVPSITADGGDPWGNSTVRIQAGDKTLVFETKMIYNRVGLGARKGKTYYQWPTRLKND